MRRTRQRLTVALLSTWLGAYSPTILAQEAAGEVLKIDAGQQKITLRHEAIKSLDMPAMSMAYRVKDSALLQGLKVGDKVRFDAEKLNGQYVVTRITH